MILKKLLENIDYQVAASSGDIGQVDINNITTDSRRVREGNLFIATPGEIFDGADFIAEAVSRGARAIVSSVDFVAKGVIKVITPDTRAAGIIIADNYFSRPQEGLSLIGITGTNGKTTTSYLIRSILEKANCKPGIIGTISYHLGQRMIPSGNTTPGAIKIREYLGEMRKADLSHAVMEVSSHALSQGRLDGLDFDQAIFTNLTPDHLDYHQSMDEYFKAKARLFSSLANDKTAIINNDDEYNQKLKSKTKAGIVTYGIKAPSDVSATDIILSNNKTKFLMKLGNNEYQITTPLIGRHNIYNILAAAACGYSSDISGELIVSGIEGLANVPGRLEEIDTERDFQVFVDYAHTENALLNVLLSIRNFHGGNLTLVFGCGGDRDHSKRAPMGRVASEYANKLIITSDNPRSENPAVIADEVFSGVKPNSDCQIILGRYQAIQSAIENAQANEIILIAGKGHETYQVLGNTILPFDDREITREILNTHAKVYNKRN